MYVIIAITGVGDDINAKNTDKTNKEEACKKCAPFTNCISSKINIEKDNTEYIDVAMPMHNLIEYSGNYSKHQEVCGNITDMIQMKI